jgi:hypothetical protein
MACAFLECGGKRSATPLWIIRPGTLANRSFAFIEIQSAVAASLCRRTPHRLTPAAAGAYKQQLKNVVS